MSRIYKYYISKHIIPFTLKMFILTMLTSLVWASNYIGLNTLYMWIAVYILSIFMFLPKYMLSPINMLFAYYGLWFVLPPLFGSTYTNGSMDNVYYDVSLALATTNFVVCLLFLKFGEEIGKKLKVYESESLNILDIRLSHLVILYLISTSMILLIVFNSGGIARWIENPGDAFLNRAGSGVYVILSHFFSIPLAALSGYYAYRKRNFFSVMIFFLWVAITSPVHGSKFQISLLVLISLLPWLRSKKTLSVEVFLVGIILVCVFLLGMFFRGFDVFDLEKLPTLFGYFTTLHNLAISIRDFEPGELFTFFLPFYKFLTPFGLEGGVEYYDMNHLLTDIYYPKAWEIRATEQWPVETDLYLNFYYWGGIPLIAFYMSTLGLLSSASMRFNNLGASVLSLLSTVFMLSHLRGSLYNHTDFYMLPYFLIIFFCLKRFRFG